MTYSLTRNHLPETTFANASFPATHLISNSCITTPFALDQKAMAGIQSGQNEASDSEDAGYQGSLHQRSIKEQAEQHRLATLRINLHCVEPQWREGSGVNRPVNSAHVNRLVKAFKNVGVCRQAAENRLAVGCSNAEWRRAREAILPLWTAQLASSVSSGITDPAGHVAKAFSASNTDPDHTIPVIENWADHAGMAFELLNGQHRRQAFLQYWEAPGPQHLAEAETEGEVRQIYFPCPVSQLYSVRPPLFLQPRGVD